MVGKMSFSPSEVVRKRSGLVSESRYAVTYSSLPCSKVYQDLCKLVEIKTFVKKLHTIHL